MFRQLGPTEILLILGVVVLLFGGRKLPELARGSGRALRIFKSEVKEDAAESGDQPAVESTREQRSADPDEATRRNEQA